MAIIGALDHTKHFSEFDYPLNPGYRVNGGVETAQYTPGERKALALGNLYGLNPEDTSLIGASGLVGNPASGVEVTALTFDGISYDFVLAFEDLTGFLTDDSANLASGALLFTLGDGAWIIEKAELSVAFEFIASTSPTTDTPEVGLGTTVGTGAAATLSGTMEDIVDGGATGLVGGTAISPSVAGAVVVKGQYTPVYIAAAGGKAHTVFLNWADGWADLTPNDSPAHATGTVKLRARKL